MGIANVSVSDVINTAFVVNRLKAKLEATSLRVSTENIKIIKDSTSPRSSSKLPQTSIVAAPQQHRARQQSRSSTPRSSRHRVSQVPHDNGGTPHSERAATKIQVGLSYSISAESSALLPMDGHRLKLSCRQLKCGVFIPLFA